MVASVSVSRRGRVDQLQGAVAIISKILERWRACRFDFRRFAHPDDPLASEFPAWVDYYRLKWAIAAVIKPVSLLEIGVRYGYSAISFLDAAPGCRYLGLDLDCPRYGGVPGALDWARTLLEPYAAELQAVDTQTLDKLPGHTYDLIHVDGQQDGDGTFHDLTLAVEKGRHVLLDGFHWSRENFLAASEFLFQNRALFESYFVLPSYAGELLITVATTATPRKRSADAACRSTDLTHHYTTGYYLSDCSGFSQYRRYGGRFLEDPRHQALVSIAAGSKPQRVLDLGCGRGELCYFFARRGARVLGIDFSEDALQLAAACVASGSPQAAARVELRLGDVCTTPIDGHFDLAIASDLVEHLAVDELERLYARVSHHLAPTGLFVVHTHPNRWAYDREYPRRRAAARALGSYLPPNPRGDYELAVHINEQDPPGLRQQLQRHFLNVRVWCSLSPEAAGGSLIEKFSQHELEAAPHLFAIATNADFDHAGLQACLRMELLPDDLDEPAILGFTAPPNQATACSELFVDVRLANRCRRILNSYAPFPVQLGYHWQGELDQTVTEGARRTRLVPPLQMDVEETYTLRIDVPDQRGEYRLRVALVQEFRRWYSERGQECRVSIV